MTAVPNFRDFKHSYSCGLIGEKSIKVGGKRDGGSSYLLMF